MRRFKLFCILLFIISFAANAQKDTLYLDEVKIMMPRLLKYSYGGNIISINKKSANQNLNQLITEAAAVYFKNYGNGQLSTVTLRGTTAAHTAVIWNGIPVNSPSLGLSDFSLWPSYLLDNIAVNLGGASAAFGSGAIGGTVLLSQAEPIFENGLLTNVHLEAGSFSNYTTAATVKHSNQLLVSQTKLFRNSIVNDFYIPSENRKQNNAAVLKYGIDQQLHFKLKSDQTLSFEGLYIYNHREVQEVKTNKIATNQIQDENLRLSLSYQNEMGLGIWNTNLGYVINDSRYNISSKTKTKQITASSDYEIAIGSFASIKSGILYTKLLSDVDSYDPQVNENRLDIYSALNIAIEEKFRISAHLRKGFYTDKSFPFIPSLGLEYDVIKSPNDRLTIKSLASKSFRIPTLNDRYWGTQGNRNLLSESGNNIEAGLVFNHALGEMNFSISATHYRSWIDNLIVWLPDNGGIFVPHNQREVITSGLELSLKLSAKLSQGELSLQANYHYAKSTNQKGLNEFDQTGVNKQLPYVPFHTGNLTLSYQISTWNFHAMMDYTGKRFTTLDNSEFNSIEAYSLINLSIAKQLKIASLDFNSFLRVNNLLNTEYENYKNYAQPLRNFSLGLDININK